MNIQIENSWKNMLKDELKKPYFVKLSETIQNAYGCGEEVYPPQQSIFSAFYYCPFSAVKVVILGQDPYHGQGQANGLCFSVNDEMAVPPSLKNIYKEIHNDLGLPIPQTGDLTHWAKQGVLLLNATLTVLGGHPGSHQGIGWEEFTNAVVQKLSDEGENIVFLLWGKYAQKKGSVINTAKHLVLTAPHPSPFSAYTGFFGCKHFSKTNNYLCEHGKAEISWDVAYKK